MRPIAHLWGMALAALGVMALPAADKTTFDDQVLPIFRNKCLKCHNPDRMRADLDLSTFDAALKGSGNGAVLASGDPNGSKLLKVVTHEEKPTMPPDDKLPAAEIEVIRQWIAGGLLQNSGSKAISASKPKVNLVVDANATGRPAGPPPMPDHVLALDPYVRTVRTSVATAMAHNPWSPIVAIGGQRQVLLFNTDTLRVAGIIPFPDGYPNCVRFSANGRLLIIGGGRGANKGISTVWDITTGVQVLTVGDDLDAVLSTDISPNQRFIAHGGPDRLVRIFSTETGELVHKIKKHTDWITSVRFSVDSKHVATGDRGGGLHVWEVEPGQIVGTLPGHTDRITGLEWATTNIVASASMDSTARLWNTDTISQVGNWGAHGAGAMSLARAPSGQLVTSGGNNRATLWNPGGARVMDFVFPGEMPAQAALSHDSRRVVGSDWSGLVYVWNAADGKEVGRLTTNPETQAEQLVLVIKAREDKQAAATAAQAALKAAQDQVAAAQARMAALDAAVAAQQKSVADAKANIDKAVTGKQKPAQDNAAAATKALTDGQTAKTAADQALTTANAVVTTAAQAHQVAAQAAATSAKLATDAQNDAAKPPAEKQKLAADAAAKKEAEVAAKAAWDKLKTDQQVPAQNKAAAAAKALADALAAKTEMDKLLVAANTEVQAADVVFKAAQKSLADAQQAAQTGKPVALQQVDALTKQMPDLQNKSAGAAAELVSAQEAVVMTELGKGFSQFYNLRRETEDQKARADQSQAASQAAQAALQSARLALATAKGLNVDALKAQRAEGIKKAQTEQATAGQDLAVVSVEVAKANTAIAEATKSASDAEATLKTAAANMESAKASMQKAAAAAKAARDKATAEKAVQDKFAAEKHAPAMAALDGATKAMIKVAADKAAGDKVLAGATAEAAGAAVAFQFADKAAQASEAAVAAGKAEAQAVLAELNKLLNEAKAEHARQVAAKADNATLETLANETIKPVEAALVKLTAGWAAQQGLAASQRDAAVAAKVLNEKKTAGKTAATTAANAAAATLATATAAREAAAKSAAQMTAELGEFSKRHQAADQSAKTAEAAVPPAEAELARMVAAAGVSKSAADASNLKLATAKAAMAKVVSEKQQPAESRVAAAKQALADAQLSHQNTEADHAANLVSLAKAEQAGATVASEKAAQAAQLARDLAAIQARLAEVKAAYDKLKSAISAPKSAATK